MRILEVCLLLSEIIVFLFFFFPIPKRPIFKKLFFVFPLLIAFLHLILEGGRWQMLPAHLIALIIGIAGAGKLFYRLPKYLKILLWGVGFVLLCISAVLAYILPVFQLPQPDGPFLVGTSYLHLIDSSRAEIITANSSDQREIMVRVWYPAESASEERFPYMSSVYAEAFGQTEGIPASGLILSHFKLIQTHSWKDVSLAESQLSYPVIIFSHGYMWHSSMYTAMLENLASHGYIILSIDYTYETPMSAFPNENLRFYRQEYIDSIWENVSWEYIQSRIDSFKVTEDLAERKRLVREYLEHIAYTQRVDAWAADVRFIIDQLHEDKQSPHRKLLEKADLSKIGVMGHSLGGATSALTCATDSRVKAGINMDGTQWGSLMDKEIRQPFMFLTALRETIENDIDTFIYAQSTKNDFYHLSIAGATHANFGDLSLWSNYASITHTGSIEGSRMLHITNNAVLTFFNQYLKQESVGIKSLMHEFNELVLTSEKHHD